MTALDRALIATVGLLVATRVALLPVSPPGFFLDEAAGGAHVEAMLRSGTDAHGEGWPLFSASLGGGYTTPVYLYPLTAWARVFGTDPLALRAFSVAATLAAVVALALGARLWLDRTFALGTAAVALALPWGWLQGGLAWDPALVPLLVAGAFLALSRLLFSEHHGHRLVAAFGLPTSLVGLAYLYPPCRATAPLLFVLAYALLLRRHAVSPAVVAASAAYAVVLALPLARFMTTPEARARSRMLSVFSGGSTWDGVLATVTNLWHLLDPVFLFGRGDANLRHSTGHQGMLGLGTLLPALVVIAYAGHALAQSRRHPGRPASRTHLLVGTAAAGAVAGLLGSALTDEGQPHSLRATAAWPFLALLVALGWSLLLRHAVRVAAVAAGVLVLGTWTYAADLADGYRERAGVWFDVPALDQLQRGETVPGYPDLALRYHRG